LGISVDPLICPALLSLTLLIMLVLAKIIFAEFSEKQSIFNKSKYLFITFSVYLVAFFIYYFGNIEGITNDHHLNYGTLSFIGYVKENFMDFVIKYYNHFFYENYFLFVFLFLFIIAICALKYYEREKSIRLSQVVVVNIFSFLIFFFSTFLIGFCWEPQTYWATFSKWTSLYLYAFLFYFMILIGFAIDRNSKLQIFSDEIKSLFVIFVFILFFEPLIAQYPEKLKTFEQSQKTLKAILYNSERLALSKNLSEIYLPKSYQTDCFIDSGKELWFLVYVNSVHPYQNIKTSIIFTDDNDYKLLDSEQIKNKRFKPFLREKRKRIHKRFFMDYRENLERSED